MSDGGVIDNPPVLSNWNSTTSGDYLVIACGQIGMTAMLTGLSFKHLTLPKEISMLNLEQAGADEVVTLDHNNADLDDYASLTLDRSSATQGAEVMLFIVDQQLNIDPTDEDVVDL